MSVQTVTGLGRSPEQRAARLAEVHEQLAEAVAAAARNPIDDDFSGTKARRYPYAF